jgi:hypothetical protein
MHNAPGITVMETEWRSTQPNRGLVEKMKPVGHATKPPQHRSDPYGPRILAHIRAGACIPTLNSRDDSS